MAENVTQGIIIHIHRAGYEKSRIFFPFEVFWTPRYCTWKAENLAGTTRIPTEYFVKKFPMFRTHSTTQSGRTSDGPFIVAILTAELFFGKSLGRR